jgi:hypothetical protein
MKTFKSLLTVALSFGLGALTIYFVQRTSPAPSATNQICLDYSASHFTGANLDTVLSDLARYNGTHVPAVEADMRNNGINKRASRVCTFPLDTLKKFIYFLEKYSSQYRVSPQDLAIGFYYGVYPKKMISTTGEDYGSLHTLFMVPATFDQDEKRYVDYDPINNVPLAEHISKVESEEQDKVNQEKKDKVDQGKRDDDKQKEKNKGKSKESYKAFILGMPRTTQSRSFAASASSTLQPMLKNQGGLCPPRCPPPSTNSLLNGTESY